MGIVVLWIIGIVMAIIAIVVSSTIAKWVCGILAVAFIIWATCKTIKAIYAKTHPDYYAKKREKVLKKAIEKSMNSPNFEKRMTEAAQRRNLLFDGQRPNSPDYGFSPDNPIMSSTISSSYDYLESLRTLDGEPFTFDRVGSLSLAELYGVKDVIIDKYQLYLNGKEYKTIYICPYGHSHSFAPEGMMLAEEEKEE